MLGSVLIAVASLAVGIAAYLLGLGVVIAVTIAALAAVGGVFIFRFETILGDAQPRPEQGRARTDLPRPGLPRSDDLVKRRRAADWRPTDESAEQVQPSENPGTHDIQAG